MKALEGKLIRILQDSKIRQQMASNGKSIQIVINNQIVGDSAIEKATAENGDVKNAMRYILTCLPKPKLQWLRFLTIAVLLEDGVPYREVAKELGIARWTFTPSAPHRKYIEMIRSGEVDLNPLEEEPYVGHEEKTVTIK